MTWFTGLPARTGVKYHGWYVEATPQGEWEACNNETGEIIWAITLGGLYTQIDQAAVTA